MRLSEVTRGVFLRIGQDVFPIDDAQYRAWRSANTNLIHPIQACLRKPATITESERDAAGATFTERSLPVVDRLVDLPREAVVPYLNHGGGGNAAMEAWRTFLGARRYYAEDGFRPGLPIVWGILRGSGDIINHARARNWRFFHTDHAYFQRGHQRMTYRVSYCGFEIDRILDRPDDRLMKFGVHIAPWRPAGEAIIVCPPTDYFAAFHGCEGWLGDTIQALRMHTDRPIIIRGKPRQAGDQPPIEGDFERAHLVVTHSSNVAIEALLYGVPVLVAPTSAAAPVGITDPANVEAPVRPERHIWASALAYQQFDIDEMRSGNAWTLLSDTVMDLELNCSGKIT